MIAWWILPLVLTVALTLYLLLIRPGRQYAGEFGSSIWWTAVFMSGVICLLVWLTGFALKVLA